MAKLCNKVIVILIVLGVSLPAYAALDIFDHPRDMEKKQKASRRQAEVNFLDYPKECFLKGNYRDALGSCQRLLTLEPAKGLKDQILYLMGLSLLKLNRPSEARGYFNEVLLMERLDKDMKINVTLGIAGSYFLEDNFDKAIASYNQILELYPRNNMTSVVYYKLAWALEKTGKSEEAGIYYNKVKQEFPLSFEARLAMATNTPVANSAVVEVGNSYTIQVGCFSDKDNADKVCEKLVKEGFSAYIYTSGSDEAPLFHVRAGRLTSKKEAEALEGKLKNAGYSTKICP